MVLRVSRIPVRSPQYFLSGAGDRSRCPSHATTVGVDNGPWSESNQRQSEEALGRGSLIVLIEGQKLCGTMEPKLKRIFSSSVSVI